MKKFINGFLISLFAAISQGAFAHTTILDQGMEGSTVRTFINIPHGCGHLTKIGNLGVKAMSVVFPNAVDSEATRVDTGEPISLSTVMSGANDFNGGLVVISPRVVKTTDVFQINTPLKDANGNVHGIRYVDGYLEPELTGIFPFQAALGSFVPASCAKKIIARVGIANYCTKGTGVRHADIWIGHLTPAFNDPNIVSVQPDGSPLSPPFWPGLVINRNLVTNPLDAACGAGFDVTLEPSSADIDATLPIDGYNP
ncbi:MAG: hypothetical protein ACRERV_15575 [Methylococcales bacterium]